MAALEAKVISSRDGVKQSEVIGKGDALAILRQGRDASRDSSREQAVPVNAVSEAARTLGQRGAEARRAQQPPQVDKVAQTVRPAVKPAPLADKPFDEPEENADQEFVPEGQDAVEEQSQEGDEQLDDSDESAGNGEPTITIDGVKITAQEIKDSYLRRDDYSRKTAGIAERERVLDNVMTGVTQSSQRLDQLVGILQNAVGQEPDWANVAATWQGSPQQFIAYKESFTQQRNALNNVVAERQRSFQATVEQAKAAMFDEAARTFKPEWADRTKLNEGVTKLADFAVSMGIRPEELQMLYRTPMLRILDMAHELQTIKGQQRNTDRKVLTKPKPLRPGTQRSRPSAADAQLESERQIWESNKSPSVKDSMRWLKAKTNFEVTTGRRA